MICRTDYMLYKEEIHYGVYSRRFGVSIARIVMLNRIANPNLIYPGNVLRNIKNEGNKAPLNYF